MDKNRSTDSVYSLITDLVEKFTTHPTKIKQYRTKCFEYLLGKKEPTYQKSFRDVTETSDPYIKLLCWNFSLTQDFDRADLAENLQIHVDILKNCYREDVNSFNRILQFLLNLRSIPAKDDKFDLSSLPDINDLVSKYDDIFNLSTNLMDDDGSYTVDLRPERKSSQISCIQSKSTIYSDFIIDEGYVSPTKENVWEIAAKYELPKRRTWENFGSAFPDKEKPFLSELGELSSLWVENLYSLYPKKVAFESKLKPKRVFLNDVKLLLVGIQSESFKYNEKRGFYLENGVSVEDVASDTLECFCRDFIFSACCYKDLEKISLPDYYTREYKHPGYIFKEFCTGINRYLEFYRMAIFSLSDTTNFLNFYQKTKKTRLQITTLSSICKVGPYATEEIPHGVTLLGYLYRKILMVTNNDVLLVLYSILFACCQVYFRQFLQQWILEGSINDMYGEFFIMLNKKHVHSRGRTYWTRSFCIRQDMIPDFLLDFKDDILFCGKMMNLLRHCLPSNALNLYLRGKKPLIFSCCLNNDQLLAIQQNATTYYLEASMDCSPKFNINKIIDEQNHQDPYVLELIAKKQAATLKRIELERQKIAQEKHEKKMEELSSLREQYDLVLEQKQIRILKEIEKEIKLIQDNSTLEEMREKLVQEESQKLIDHYTNLCEIAENRKAKIDKHIKFASSILLENNIIEKQVSKQEEIAQIQNDSSSESFYSTATTIIPENIEIIANIPSSTSLDLLNANTQSSSELKNNNDNETIRQTIDNFEQAKRNKKRVLTQEMGIETPENTQKTNKIKPDTTNLTQAQKNKLKVLSSEFGIQFIPEQPNVERILTTAQRNRNRVLGTNECFKVDNENFVNKNVITKSKSLTLEIPKPVVEKVTPMSVDSTPMSEVVSDLPNTPSTSTMFMSVDTAAFSSVPATGDAGNNVEGFDFNKEVDTSVVPVYINSNISKIDVEVKKVFSKRASIEEAVAVSNGSLKVFLKESIKVPLMTQIELANNEILKYFIRDLKYMEHLKNLRKYFFLIDGEFGRHIAENLFSKLYNANFPVDLINCRTLHHLVFEALDLSSKNQEECACLSFKVNNLPKRFDLRDPDVLSCLSLTYKVDWPLNILLPTDALEKYDEVFKYLMKLKRVSWVLKKTFLEMKILAKESGKKEIYLMASPHYRRVHQFRHVMTHFIQTLQNYVIGEVLHPSWTNFEKNLRNIKNLDEVYAAHTIYIKNILYQCLLNQKTAPLRNIIQKIFVVILKFYDYLRSKPWKCEEGSYVHPNFDKLESIFKNFEEFVFYLFKVGKKLSKTAYQFHLVQLLDTLNINGHYNQK